MISFFTTLFGALLAILGGFLHQMYQNNLTQKRDDREHLFKVLEILYDMKPTLDDLPAPLEDMKEPRKKLLLIGSRVYTKSNSDIADKIVAFARMPVKWTQDEENKLFQNIAEVCSKPLDRYHKRENERIEKVAEELKQGRKVRMGKEKKSSKSAG
jgi:hypothetical protein